MGFLLFQAWFQTKAWFSIGPMYIFMYTLPNLLNLCLVRSWLDVTILINLHDTIIWWHRLHALLCLAKCFTFPASKYARSGAQGEGERNSQNNLLILLRIYTGDTGAFNLYNISAENVKLFLLKQMYTSLLFLSARKWDYGYFLSGWPVPGKPSSQTIWLKV